MCSYYSFSPVFLGHNKYQNYRPIDVLAYCDTQARKTVNEKPAKNLLPVVIDKNNSFWKQGCG